MSPYPRGRVNPVVVRAAAAAQAAAAGVLLLVVLRLRHRLRHDPLTGAPNRAALTALLARLTRRRAPVAVAMVDLQRFKQVNDTFGHDAGDRVLTAVAARLRCCGPPVMLAARLAGDEFAVICDLTATDPAGCGQAVWRAITTDPVTLPAGRQIPVQAAVGLATATPGDDPGTLLRHADLAMYRAKAAGGGVAVHTDNYADPPVTARPLHRPRDRPRS